MPAPETALVITMGTVTESLSVSNVATTWSISALSCGDTRCRSGNASAESRANAGTSIEAALSSRGFLDADLRHVRTFPRTARSLGLVARSILVITTIILKPSFKHRSRWTRAGSVVGWSSSEPGVPPVSPSFAARQNAAQSGCHETRARNVDFANLDKPGESDTCSSKLTSEHYKDSRSVKGKGEGVR